MDKASRAIELYESGNFNSLAAAGRATQAPSSTVNDRRHGILPRLQTTLPHARLRRYQEEIMVKYIQDLQLQYAPINQAQLQIIAEKLAQANNPTARLGKNWIYRFIKRRPELITARNRSFEATRIKASIPHRIQSWYAYVDSAIQRFSITPQDIWNIDEIGY